MLLPIDPQRTIRELKELRALTSDQDGAQRVAWTPMWLQARDWFTSKLAGLPIEDHYDAAGNRWITLRGKSEKALLLGSHIDSVPNGGWLDGALGLMAALETLRAFAALPDGPPLTIRVVDFADEEGARFGRSVLGSSAFAGTHSITQDRIKRDKDGITMEAALQTCGINIERFPEAERERTNAAAYLELHIEQGPILERMGLPLAAVLGTKGVERHKITFMGQEAHAGSTPMSARRDAFAAAARFALAVRDIARRTPEAVCTTGSVKTYPGIATAIAGRCEMTLDQRHLNAAVLAGIHQQARDASTDIATDEGCTVEWDRIWNIEPVPFHPHLIDLCGEAIRDVTAAATFERLPSGPLHDAAEVSRAGIPAVMLFVQSLGGISHNKIEDTREEHLELAIQAYAALAEKTAAWILLDA
ncbi:Zn-dependent hydrolase [Bryobacterales bacterium F-183]|nr:Zn-dependent hydrolase [Bryobacterales bacterium F-183]